VGEAKAIKMRNRAVSSSQTTPREVKMETQNFPEGKSEKLGYVPSKSSSIRRAIWDKCLGCDPDSDPHLCREKDCPLYRKWDKGKQGSKLSPLQAVKRYCAWCFNGQSRQVRDCTATHCSLYPYRMGHNPKLKGKGPERPIWLR